MKKLLSIVLSAVILLSTITAFGAENKFGVDVSSHNGVVDFSSSVKAGKSFVMIRLGNYNILDKCFWDNVKSACNSNLDFGVYLYSAAFDNDEARIEANFVINTLKEMPAEYKSHFKYPVAYDMEASKLEEFSKSQLTNQVVVFCDKVLSAGYVPMVYANNYWYTDKLDVKKLNEKGYKFWLAHYVSNPDFSVKKQIASTGIYADMWQYKAGNIENGTLDQNVVFNETSLLHLYRITSNIAPTCVKTGKKIYTCAACGKSYSKTIEATGKHTYSKTVTKSPTSSVEGVMTYSCKTCTKKYTKPISKIAKTSIKSINAKSKGFTVSWNKASNSSGYQIMYSTSSKFSTSKTLTVSSSTTFSKTVSKLLAKKKYYVKVRSYRTINSKKYYSSWSGYKYVTTKP